jgi:serine/threonine protein phosphatase PrpC
MGNCCVGQAPVISDTIEYQEQVTIHIKEKDNKGKTIRTDDVAFKVSSPASQQNEVYSLNKLNFALSACVLPGLDPRDLINKDCQDGCVSIFHESTLLLALFDGHGKEGQRVAQFCITFMRDFFISQHSIFLTDPEEAMRKVIEDCDEALRQKSSKIDSSLSGTTAVVVFITEEGIHVASVGDSRAVLATIPSDNQSILSPEHSTNPYARKLDPSRALSAVSMTVDQKPNHQAELERIEKSGGKVQQLTDDFGNKVGPFRVWQKNGILPGLAMSRSIGDGVAKEIGVTSEPIYHFFPHFHYRDQFLVMASDGVWDVMENQEVVNFVERFRKKCLKKSGPRAYPHRVREN